MSMIDFMQSRVEHEKSFITSEPGDRLCCSEVHICHVHPWLLGKIHISASFSV